jgi:hypothetical protein
MRENEIPILAAALRCSAHIYCSVFHLISDVKVELSCLTMPAKEVIHTSKSTQGNVLR